jgi:hypothetical protein
MNRSRAYAAAGLGVAIAVAMTGCGLRPTPIPDPYQLNCTWTSAGRPDQMIFQIDGRLIWKQVSEKTFDPPGLPGFPRFERSGVGRWELGDGLRLRGTTGDPAVTVLFDQSNGDSIAEVLTVRGAGRSLRLVAERSLDLEGDNIEFTPSNCAELTK